MGLQTWFKQASKKCVTPVTNATVTESPIISNALSVTTSTNPPQQAVTPATKQESLQAPLSSIQKKASSNTILGKESHSQSPKISPKNSSTHFSSDPKHGVLFHGLDPHGKPLAPKKICSHLEITALTRNQLSENWSRLLEFKDRDQVHHQFALPMELMSGDGNEYRKELAVKQSLNK
jgi:hypothetical protein